MELGSLEAPRNLEYSKAPKVFPAQQNFRLWNQISRWPIFGKKKDLENLKSHEGFFSYP